LPRRSIKKYLEDVYWVVKETLTSSIKGRLCCLVVFGSAARPEDFVKGLSDVDVLALTEDRPERRHYFFKALDSEVHAVVFAVDEFRELVEHGDPLAFMMKHRIELHGSIDDLLVNLKITERTAEVLRGSALAALGLALEHYYVLRDHVKALSHLYHSVRHVARYKASLRGVFPVSDEEVLRECVDEQLRSLYWRLVKARRSEVDAGSLRCLMREAVSLISSELGIKEASLEKLEEVAAGGAVMVTASEENGCLAFKVEVFNGDRRVLEVVGDEVRETVKEDLGLAIKQRKH